MTIKQVVFAEMEAYGTAGMVAAGCFVEAVDKAHVEGYAIVEVDLNLYS